VKTIAVVGLGYVGLPLAVAFGKKGPTIGFDLDENKRLEWIAIEAGKPKYLEEHSFRQRTENYLLLFHACIWLIIFYATARSLGQRINT